MSAVFRVTLLLAAICVACTSAQLVGIPPACDSYTWTADGLPANLTACTSFTGAVVIDASTLSNTTFLKQVTSIGSLKISNNAALSSIDLDALTKINGSLTLSANTNLTTVSIGELTDINGPVSLTNLGNGNLTSINFAKLTSVASDFAVTSAKTLIPLIPLLATVGGKFSIASSDSTAAYSVALLNTVGSLEIKDNKFASSISFPKLATVAGVGATVGPVVITGNNDATSLSFAVLSNVTGAISIQANKVYTLSFPALKNATFTTFNLPEYSCTAATALFTQAYTTAPVGTVCTNAIKCHPDLAAPANGFLPTTYNNTYGAPGQNVACNGGYQVSGGNRTCQADGTWAGVDQTCAQCAAGKYHSGADAMACMDCADNFASLAGAASCTACPDGFYSGGATPGRTMCYCKTDAGAYAPAGDASCKKASGASMASGLPVVVLAALAGLTVMANRA